MYEILVPSALVVGVLLLNLSLIGYFLKNVKSGIEDQIGELRETLKSLATASAVKDENQRLSNEIADTNAKMAETVRTSEYAEFRRLDREDRLHMEKKIDDMRLEMQKAYNQIMAILNNQPTRDELMRHEQRDEAFQARIERKLE